MKFLLDVHMPPKLAILLEEDGHSSHLVARVADPRLPDIDILLIAEEHDEVGNRHNRFVRDQKVYINILAKKKVDEQSARLIFNSRDLIFA